MNNHALNEALRGVARLYAEGLQAHGATSKSVGWKDADQQILRFEKLAQVVDDPDVFVANDFGCGYGAMFEYLDNRYGASLEGYHGYDISSEMLAAARSRVHDSRADFILGGEITREADYSFASGTYNVRMGAGEDAWRSFIESSIIRLATQSRRGFAFNLLSTYVEWKDEKLFYADPLYFFDFCKRNVSSRVTLLHDYPLYEWTVYVRL